MKTISSRKIAFRDKFGQSINIMENRIILFLNWVFFRCVWLFIRHADLLISNNVENVFCRNVHLKPGCCLHTHWWIHNALFHLNLSNEERNLHHHHQGRIHATWCSLSLFFDLLKLYKQGNGAALSNSLQFSVDSRYWILFMYRKKIFWKKKCKQIGNNLSQLKVNPKGKGFNVFKAMNKYSLANFEFFSILIKASLRKYVIGIV